MTYRSRIPLFREYRYEYRKYSRSVLLQKSFASCKIRLVLAVTSMHVALHETCKWMRAIRALMHRWANAASAWVGECIHSRSSRVSRVSLQPAILSIVLRLWHVLVICSDLFRLRYSVTLLHDYKNIMFAKVCISLRKSLIHMIYITTSLSCK